MKSSQAAMLMNYWIGNRRQPYRPAVVSSSNGHVQVCGLLPIRSGALVEIRDAQAHDAPQSQTLRVESCMCGPDGLFRIDLTPENSA